MNSYEQALINHSINRIHVFSKSTERPKQNIRTSNSRECLNPYTIFSEYSQNINFWLKSKFIHFLTQNLETFCIEH